MITDVLHIGIDLQKSKILVPKKVEKKELKIFKIFDRMIS